ncbi:MAG: DUF559 domain-containing protein [Pseudonocardiales bacterium]
MVALPEHLRGPWTHAELRTKLGRRTLERMLADGRIRQIWGVLIPRETLLDPFIRASAALLAAGSTAALTGLTAAWLQGCPAAESCTVHVAVPYSRSLRAREGLVVHQGRRLLEEVIDVRGLRTVSLEVAVTELLCTDVARRALAVADQAAALIPEFERPGFRLRIASRLTTRADRRGTARANALLPLVTGRADSPPESWLKLLVVEAGFPQPVDQFKVVDTLDAVLYVLDLCWPSLRIALEYDGYEAHEHRKDRDARRDRDLRRRGWITIRATAADLCEPTELLERLDEAFRTRGAVGCRVALGEQRVQKRRASGERQGPRYVAKDVTLR